jgi:hypothetical protein
MTPEADDLLHHALPTAETMAAVKQRDGATGLR